MTASTSFMMSSASFTCGEFLPPPPPPFEGVVLPPPPPPPPRKLAGSKAPFCSAFFHAVKRRASYFCCTFSSALILASTALLRSASVAAPASTTVYPVITSSDVSVIWLYRWVVLALTAPRPRPCLNNSSALSMVISSPDLKLRYFELAEICSNSCNSS